MLLVTLDGAHQVIEAIDGLKAGAPRAIVRALNRAIGSARTVEVQAIAADTGLKSSDVRKALVMSPATMSRPVASLSAGLKRIPLIDFRATGPEPSRGQGHGVNYRLQGGKDTLPNAFIATMRSGHRGVFMRKGTRRLPIKELFGPSLGRVFLKYRPEAVARAEEMFVSNFEHEMMAAWGWTPVPASDGTSHAGPE